MAKMSSHTCTSEATATRKWSRSAAITSDSGLRNACDTKARGAPKADGHACATLQRPSAAVAGMTNRSTTASVVIAAPPGSGATTAS